MISANERAAAQGIKRYVKAPQIAFQDVKAGISNDRDLEQQIEIFEAAVQSSTDIVDTGKYSTSSAYIAELNARTEVANRRARTERRYALEHNKEQFETATVYLDDRVPEPEIHAKPLNEYTLAGFEKHADALLSRTMQTGSTDRWISYQQNYMKGFNALLDQYSASENGNVSASKKEIATAIRKGLLQLDPATFRRMYYSRTAGDIDYLQSDEAQNLKDEEIEDKFRHISDMFELGIYDSKGNLNPRQVQKILGS